jgi:hypothetical protein
MQLSVNLLAMPNPQYRHGRVGIIDIVQDAVNPHANPPASFSVFQLLASGRPWIFRKRKHPLLDQFISLRGNSVMVLLGHWENEDPVFHLRFRRFSANACSKGIGVSPKAFASSHARMSSKSSSSSRIFSYSSMLMTTATFSPRSLTRNCGFEVMTGLFPECTANKERRAMETV